MNDRGGSRADHEHRASVRTSADLSVLGDEGTDGLSVAVSRTPDPTDSTAPGSSLLTLSSPTTPDDRSIQRPSSVHSRTPSIAKSHDQSDTQLRRDVVSPETGMREAVDLSVQTEVPCKSPSTPSHPYETYHQRAMSASTQSISTAGPDSFYSGSRGPTHPYRLYPQSIPSSGATQPGDIPVGFPVLENTYPDTAGAGGRDVGSVVASLAHSEELPPYTRYPDNDLAAKPVDPPSMTENLSARGDRRPGAASIITPPPDIPAIPGAGGLGLATRDPEFAATSSEPASPRTSTPSFTSDDSRHEINASSSAVVSEKLARNSWRQRATRKLWGAIPYWVIGLLGIVLILMATIIGAVIGAFMSKQEKTSKGDKQHRPPFGEFNATQDVVLLNSVPPDLPDLGIGEWGLPPPVVNQAPSTCLKTPSQSPAWTCNTPFNIYWVDILETDTAPTSAYQLRLTTSKNGTAFTKYAWGARPPVIPGHEALRLVRDPFEPGLGPAWWVRVPYNKTVVLPEDRLPRSAAGANNRARRSLTLDRASTSGGGEARGQGDHVRDIWGSDNDADSTESSSLTKPAPASAFPFPGAKEGDRPWICTWPGTVLEFFIYPGQNNTFSARAATASFTGFPGVPAPTKPPTFLGKPPTGEATPTWPPGSPAETQSANLTGGKSGTSWAIPKFPSLPPPFPKIVRISERRADGLADAAAFCEQVEIIDGGKDHRAVLDEKGRAVQVVIREQTKKSWSRPDDGTDTGKVLSRDTPRGECGCVWMIE